MSVSQLLTGFRTAFPLSGQANQVCGVATLVSGLATVSLPAGFLSASDLVFVSKVGATGTPTFSYQCSLNPGANNFVVSAVNTAGAVQSTDVSTVVWLIVKSL